MVSVPPVHKLTSMYQFVVAKEAAVIVEKQGAIVLGSVTDNIIKSARNTAKFSPELLAVRPFIH